VLGGAHRGNHSDATDCARKARVVVKELRVGMAWAASGSSAGPAVFGDDSKTIVLMRDPRAIYASRLKGWPSPNLANGDWGERPAGWNGRKGFPYDQSIKSLCLEHLALRKRSAADPAHTLLIEYQDVLRDPHSVAQRVFAHVGVPAVPDIVVEFIDNNIQGACEHLDLDFSVCRKLQPNAVDEKWKAALDDKKLRKFMLVPECAKAVREFYPDADPPRPRSDDL
jgi:hypothetical protein